MRHVSLYAQCHGIAPYPVAVLLLIGSMACMQENSTYTDPVGGGSTGGSSGSGGSGGSSGSGGAGGSSGAGNAGSGGSAGATPIDTSDSGLARFTATLTGDTVNLTPLDPVWFESCERNPVLVQRVNDAWVPLRDDRPEASNLNHAAHYLDGAYLSDCRLSLGCDVGGCQPLSVDADPFDGYVPLIAREYVQIGQTGAPICEFEDAGTFLDAGLDAGVRLVPNIETRLPSAPLGVRVRYYRDSLCQTGPITTEVAVE